MNFEDFVDDISKEIEIKFQNNNLSRDDLEKLFTVIFSTNKLLFYFDNDKLKEIYAEKRNLYLFFVVFIKNYITQINEYINNMDLSDEYTLEISSEINEQNNKTVSLINQEIQDNSKNEKDFKLTKDKDNSQMFKQIELLLTSIENNQKSETEEKLLEKLKSNKQLLLEKEEKLKNIIDELINSRDAYLKHKAILENKFQNNLLITENIQNLKIAAEKEIKEIESKLDSFNNKIKDIIEINQKLHDESTTKFYPIF